MHLGLTPWRISGGVDAQELGRQGALAESWGYRSFWLPENHFAAAPPVEEGSAEPRPSAAANAIPDPLMLLAAVAACTRTIRLATTSYLLPLRHPLQAAEQVAVLDRLSGGRVTLGVGRGYQPAMFDAFSVSRRDKRRIFEASVRTMVRAWRGEPVVAAEGEGPPMILSPLPLQQPHPPLWVAAFGPKALAQAGTLGMPYLASPMEPVGRLRENYQRHAEACEAAGVPRPPEVPIMRTLFVSEDRALLGRVREQVAATAREMASSGLRRGISLAADDWAIVGEPSEVADKVAAYVEELGMTHLVVTRLRIGKIDSHLLERSVRMAAELLVDYATP